MSLIREIHGAKGTREGGVEIEGFPRLLYKTVRFIYNHSLIVYINL